MFTAFTSTETEKVKKGLRKRTADTFNKKDRNVTVSANVNSKEDLSKKTYKKPVDLSAYG